MHRKNISPLSLFLIATFILSTCLFLFVIGIFLTNWATRTTKTSIHQRNIRRSKLRTDTLSTLHAAGQSFATMSPIMALALMTPIIAGSAGLYVPLSILIAGIGTLLTSRTIAKFASQISSSGSLFTFVYQSITPAMGVYCGILYISAVMFLTVGTAAFLAQFAATFFQIQEVPINTLILGLVIQLSVVLVSIRGVEISAKTQIWITGISACMCLALGFVVVSSVGTVGPVVFSFSDAEENVDINTNGTVSSSSSASASSDFCKSIVYSLLIFAGYESATSMAEETKNARVAIPKAIKLTVVLCIVFYVLVTSLFSYGYRSGNDWSHDPSTVVTLASRFIGSGAGKLFFLMVVIDGWASSIALVNLISRLIHNLSQKGLFPDMFSVVHFHYQTPYLSAMLVIGTTMTVLTVVILFELGTMETIFMYCADVGGVLIQSSYFIVMIAGSIKFKSWEPIVAAMVPAIAIIGATLTSEIISPGYLTAFVIIIVTSIVIFIVSMVSPKTLIIESVGSLLPSISEEDDDFETLPLLGSEEEEENNVGGYPGIMSGIN